MLKKQWLRYILSMVLCIFFLTGCQSNVTMNDSSVQKGDIGANIELGTAKEPVIENGITGGSGVKLEQESSISKPKKDSKSELEIHFIDVGQGDSILVQNGSKTLLIDAGENNQGDVVIRYIKDLGIKKLDYVIGTHPHSDHIGGLDMVIDEFNIGTVILPVVEHSTKTYEDVLVAVSKKGLKVKKPVVGTTYSIGDAKFTIIAPNSAEYEDLNDYSVGIRLVYGSTSYLLAGDADKVSEEEMCSNGEKLSSDVMKLNHHGSAYSSTKQFVDAVSPKYAVISVGEGNSYGHPNAEVLKDMKKRGIKVYRTDLLGTIVITSDGKKIQFNKKEAQNTYVANNVGSESGESTAVGTDKKDQTAKKDSVKKKPTGNQNSDTSETYVYITPTGTKYHKKGCSYLKDNVSKITLKEAEEKGLTACSRCGG